MVSDRGDADRTIPLVLAGKFSQCRRWLQRFRHYSNHNRPNLALNGRTPVEEVLS